MAAPMSRKMFYPASSKLFLGQSVLKCKILSESITNYWNSINSTNRCTFRHFASVYNCTICRRSLVGERKILLGPCLVTKGGFGQTSRRLHVRLGSTACTAFGPSDFLRFGASYPVRFCHVSSVCWNCQSSLPPPDLGVNYFCDSCKIIQPCQEHLDYFQTMNLPRLFDVDTKDLTQTFRKFQRLLHPDKFSQKSAKEQEFSAAQSSSVNKAYSTLLKPLNRGLYLLELLGHPIEEGDSMVDNAFLMEMMELNEELSATSDLPTVKKIGEANELKIKQLMNELAELFKNERLKEARDVLAKLKYFTNIDDKVKEKLGTSTIE